MSKIKRLNFQHIAAIIDEEDLVNYLEKLLESNPKMARKKLGLTSFNRMLDTSIRVANMPGIQLLYKDDIISKHFNNNLPNNFKFSDGFKKEIHNELLTEVSGGWRWNGDLVMNSLDYFNNLNDSLLGDKKIVEVSGTLRIGYDYDDDDVENELEIKIPKSNLIGCPRPLGELVINEAVDLTSLEGMPDNLKNGFTITNCYNLKSLEHCAQNVIGDVEISYCNRLESLKGITKTINGDFINKGNHNIDSLDDGPDLVKGDYRINTSNIRISRDDYPYSTVEGEFID